MLAVSADRFEQKLSNEKQVSHALDRLTFGARPGDAELVKKIGVKKWIDQQLDPQSIPENPVLEAKLGTLKTISMTSAEMVKAYPPPQVLAAQKKKADAGGDTLPSAPSAPMAVRRPVQTVARELVEQKIDRAVMSERQLNEVLADFWFNHFNVFLDKGADRYLTTSYERDAIRPHVLGKFSNLLRATAEHPAMLFYLDNWQSISKEAGERLARFRKNNKGPVRGLNENYGRELLELHTLGVDGGYTQQDVIEVARCFTGWTIRNPEMGAGAGRAGLFGGSFYFDARVHDRGAKTVLGVKIPAGGGKEDGLRVLEIVAHHPSTAKFISRKLATRFVADNPPAALVERMAKTFTRTDGDLKAVMRTMLESREFWSEGAYKAKLKSPLELVASALRASGAEVANPVALAGLLQQMGQPLYRKQEPTGYSNNGEEWMSSNALLARMNFAVALEKNKLNGVTVKGTAVNAGAPEFQRR